MEKTTATQQKKRQKPYKLTKKQRGFVNDYVLNENGTQAALKNYDIESNNPERVASVIATENLGKPDIIEAIEVKRQTLKNALMEEGINEKYIAQKVNVLLTAKDKEGNSDFAAIDKGLKHATNIYGVEGIEDKPKSSNTYNFIFSKEVQAEIKLTEQKIKELLIKPNVQKD